MGDKQYTQPPKRHLGALIRRMPRWAWPSFKIAVALGGITALIAIIWGTWREAVTTFLVVGTLAFGITALAAYGNVGDRPKEP